MSGACPARSCTSACNTILDAINTSDLPRELPRTGQAYVAHWLSQGFLERRLPEGASEEEYELSTPAAQAIRFIASLEAPRSAATESRLSLVIQQLVQLAEQTETDPAARLSALYAERERIVTLEPFIGGACFVEISGATTRACC